MRFRELTEADCGFIRELYLTEMSQDADRVISQKFDVTERTAREWARNLNLTGNRTPLEEIKVVDEVVVKPVVEVPEEYKYLKVGRPVHFKEGGKRVLVVGDIHAPFDLDSYLDHCKEVYRMYQLDTVVFIGDIVDNHFASFHNTDPDGMGGKDELEFAKIRVQKYYQAFPKATVIIGNHDRMASRKAFAGGVPKQWIREYAEVLGVPNWNFVTDFEIDNVLYNHGEGGTAKSKVKSEEQSVAQGHLHTQCYVEWFFSKTSRKFALQVGSGIDFSRYAFAYAKFGKTPAVSCGVVLNGVQAFVIPMEL